MQLCVLFQPMSDDGDSRAHWDGYEEGLHIIRCNAFPSLKSNGYDIVHKVLGIPDMMWGMSYNGLRMLTSSLATHR